jgi:flagellar biosynthesis/type III secretory pathway M-ring protein FliF/YscJ
VDEPAVEPLLTVGRRSIGQAEVSDTFLTGHEVDDDTLRYQELGREVSQLVADDPESAAHLLRRWIGETT